MNESAGEHVGSVRRLGRAVVHAADVFNPLKGENIAVDVLSGILPILAVEFSGKDLAHNIMDVWGLPLSTATTVAVANIIAHPIATVQTAYEIGRGAVVAAATPVIAVAGAGIAVGNAAIKVAETGVAVAKKAAHVAGTGAKVLIEVGKTLLPEIGEHWKRNLAIDVAGTALLTAAVANNTPVGLQPADFQNVIPQTWFATRAIHRTVAGVKAQLRAARI